MNIEKIDHKVIKTKADLVNLSKMVKAITGSNASNEVLRELYNIEEKELKTFKGWKQDGYSVKKGSKAYTFWSAPIKGKDKQEKKVEESKEEKEYSFFNICKLFSEDQIEKI